jgi:hypothetical protein
VHRRQFPDEQNYWDANWLIVTTHCESPDDSVRISGLYLEIGDLRGFNRELQALRETMAGTATLASMEPHISVQVGLCERLGHFLVHVDLMPNTTLPAHQFEFQIDRTELELAESRCDALTTRFPTRDI